MDISKDVRYKAKNLLLEYGIGKITLDNLIYIIEQQGFEIIEYSQRDRTDSVWTLLQTLNLAPYAESGKAFAYKCGKGKLLFVCEEMTADEKLAQLRDAQMPNIKDLNIFKTIANLLIKFLKLGFATAV